MDNDSSVPCAAPKLGLISLYPSREHTIRDARHPMFRFPSRCLVLLESLDMARMILPMMAQWLAVSGCEIAFGP